MSEREKLLINRLKGVLHMAECIPPTDRLYRCMVCGVMGPQSVKLICVKHQTTRNDPKDRGNYIDGETEYIRASCSYCGHTMFFRTAKNGERIGG